MITKYRYFAGFMKRQERWLNQMAKQGYHLIRSGKASYVFETCPSDTYEYKVLFVADKSRKEMDAYKAFLEELGYDVFMKNINLNWSIGKIHLRPYAKGWGKVATNRTTYNRELFLVGRKKADAPFEFYSTYKDKIAYVRPQRNACLYLFLFALIMLLLCILPNPFMQTGSMMDIVFLSIFALAMLIPCIFYQKELHAYKKESEVNE